MIPKNLLISIILLLSFCQLKAQVIDGEQNPCPDQIYEYTFLATYCGNLSWEAVDGQIVETLSNSVKIKWNNVINGPSGSWKVRVNYVQIKFDGSCGTSTFLDMPISVKATSALNVVGDQVIPCGFRGTKTYSIQALSPLFPANSYEWITNTGWSGSSTTGTISYTVNNDNAGWIEVRGYNSTCGTYGPSKRINITRSVPMDASISGDTYFCTNAIYSIQNMPANATVSWNVSGPLSIVGSSGGTTVNVGKTGDGIGAISATLTTPCGSFTTPSKTVYIGNPTITFKPYGPICENSWPAPLSANPVPGALSRTWEAQTPNGTVTLQEVSSWKVMMPQGTIWVKLTVTTSCGTASKIQRILLSDCL